ncbi:hypothetical protein FS837_005383, partial [Tulasnella sp. UAMH 9824]
MVTTRGRLAAQSNPPKEGRDSESSETSEANREGKARRTNEPRFDDAPTSVSSSSKGKRKTKDTGRMVKTHGKGARGKLRDRMNLPIELFAE